MVIANKIDLILFFNCIGIDCINLNRIPILIDLLY